MICVYLYHKLLQNKHENSRNNRECFINSTSQLRVELNLTYNLFMVIQYLNS